MTTRLPDDPIDVAQPYPDLPAAGADAAVGGRPGARTHDAPSVVLSEERLQVGTEWVESGTVRVRRRVISEIRSIEVTLRREVLEIEDPTTSADVLSGTTSGGAADAGTPGGRDGSAAALQVVLHEEVPEVITRVRPYERATVSTVLVTDAAAPVADVVRRERVEVTGDVTTGPTGTTDGDSVRR